MKWYYFLILGVFSVVFVSNFYFEPIVVLGLTTTTSTVAVTGQAVLTQSDYRWYVNGDVLTPTSSLAGENTATSTPAGGEIIRFRMNLLAGQNVGSGLIFKLQYSNSTSSGFTDLGTTSTWVFYDNTGVADGQIIATTLLTNSNTGESYGESNPSATSPNAILSGQYCECYWVVHNNSASTSTSWYFRMIYSSGTVLDAYSRFPTLSAVSAATTTTPTSTSPGGGGGSPGGGGGGSLIFPKPIFPVFDPEGPTKPRPDSPCDNVALQKVDLSGDCRVDLIDLSILLYYYEDEGSTIARYDFDDSGVVDFPDVSVLMFYWTK